MGLRIETIGRMDQRVESLIRRYTECVETFGKAHLFTGPSVHFHLRTLERLRALSSGSKAIADDCFLESLYATLTAWGMHRMGDTDTRLVEFEDFKQSLLSVISEISAIEHLKLADLAEGEVADAAERLWAIIFELRIGIGETKIVAGSKALHHALPDLVPPIDRQYTARFFYGQKSFYGGGAKAFCEIFRRFHRIATACKSETEQLLNKGAMNTSPTKIIDNAIVGWVRTNL